MRGQLSSTQPNSNPTLTLSLPAPYLEREGKGKDQSLNKGPISSRFPREPNKGTLKMPQCLIDPYQVQ